MEPSEFPPNSEASKSPPKDEKDVQRVTTTDPIKRKKSLGRQFRETFIAGDAKTAVRYMILDIGLPTLRDAVLETLQQGLDKLFLGDSRSRRGGGATPPQTGPYGNIAYNRMSRHSPLGSAGRAMSRMARARHDFDEIVLESRTEAEVVLERLYDLVDRYDTATIADFYELVGIPASHTDHKWGWTDLRGAGITRTRNGYLLDLPEPQPIA